MPTKNSIKDQTDKEPGSNEQVQRRRFLKITSLSSVALASGAAAVLSPSVAQATDYSVFNTDPALGGNFRATRSAQLKLNAARQHFEDATRLPTQFDNNDERRYRNQRFYASFSKTLPCNAFGEVRPSAFKRLRRALRNGKQSDFDAIPLDPTASRRLENPQNALRFEVSGIDSHASRIAPSFEFRSKQAAGEMTEVYWQALTRDVPFIEYDSSASIQSAVTDLNNLSETPGPTNALGKLSSQSLFRGETPGDLTGPYISQFLLRDFNFGPSIIEQRYEVGLSGIDYMTDTANWLNVQRGATPLETAAFDSTRRYIYNNRTLAEWVHRDVLFQGHLYAALAILGMPGGAAKFDSGNPYFNGTISNQTGFGSLGDPQVVDMVTRVANMALASAWFQKWRVHRFLRPEAFGARVNFKISGDRPNYEVADELLNSGAVQTLLSRNGTALCPQAYIEGSPTHPSYPAGHASVAGACITVLKALFNEDFVIQDTVQANIDGTALIPYVGDELTIGGELNKVASNIAIGRDAAGVHYRQDGIQGLLAGQQQGIAYLQDQSRNYNEGRNFDGFTFKSFTGETIRIRNGDVSIS